MSSCVKEFTEKSSSTYLSSYLSTGEPSGGWGCVACGKKIWMGLLCIVFLPTHKNRQLCGAGSMNVVGGKDLGGGGEALRYS